jgi:DnaJ-class molecular chaperone
LVLFFARQVIKQLVTTTTTLFGRGRMTSARAFKLEVTIEELHRGCVKEIEFTRLVDCPYCSAEDYPKPKMCQFCNGTGLVKRVCRPIGVSDVVAPAVLMDEMCMECEGSGVIVTMPCRMCDDLTATLEESKMEIKIPRGTYPMDTIVLKDSDIAVTILVKPHPYFEAIPNSPDIKLNRQVVAGTYGDYSLTEGFLCKDGVTRGKILISD